MSGVAVHLHDLHRTFGSVHALDGLDLSLQPGELIALLGPSGCGKTTALRVLAGLEDADSGRVVVDGRDITGLPANRRDMGMVFQAYSLFPHLTALQNVEFGLKLRGRGGGNRERAAQMLDLVGIGSHADRYPHQLSGGQQQRVGIVRALALRPQVLLFDEPTSALDPELVGDVLSVIKELSDEGWTMVIVTHELAFAREVADEVVFMDHGLVVERGAPDVVLGSPTEERTRQFVRRLQQRF
jgi:putative spermidine/putrescine transport system ATP-binding protein